MEKFKNIIITKRDKEIFSLLNKIKVINSSIITWLISKNTKVKTFVKRLKFLKQKWYINDVRNEKIWLQIFSISYKKENLEKIESIIWEKIYKWNIHITNSLFNHEFYIWKALLYIKNKIENKTWWEINIKNNYISQYEIYELQNTNNSIDKKKLLEKLMICDWLLNIWNYSFLIEVELNNSYWKFTQKLKWYKNMMLYLNSLNENFKLFKKDLILYIFVNEYKIDKYREIIKSVWIKDLKIIVESIENL